MGRRDRDLPSSQSAAASPPESSASLIEDYFRQANTLISSVNAVHSSSMSYDKRSTYISTQLSVITLDQGTGVEEVDLLLSLSHHGGLALSQTCRPGFWLVFCAHLQARHESPL